MLGQADTGYNLLIGNLIYISYLLFMATTSCVGNWEQRVKGSSFTHPRTDHTEPSILLGVNRDIVYTT